MGQRLARWLATGSCAWTATRRDEAIERHIAETGWVDRALEHIEAGGDPDPVLKSAYDDARPPESASGGTQIDRSFAAGAGRLDGGAGPRCTPC